jgi:hypothetical protein
MTVTNVDEDSVTESVKYVNENLIGKTIASAELHENDRWPGRTMRVRFTDDTSIQIWSEYDEGWWFGPDVPGRTA